MTSQKISSRKNSSTFRKILSTYAQKDWEEPNLVCRIYKHVHNPMGGYLQFDFLCQVIPFSYICCECCNNLSAYAICQVASHSFLRVSVCIPMNQLALNR